MTPRITPLCHKGLTDTQTAEADPAIRNAIIFKLKWLLDMPDIQERHRHTAP